MVQIPVEQTPEQPTHVEVVLARVALADTGRPETEADQAHADQDAETTKAKYDAEIAEVYDAAHKENRQFDIDAAYDEAKAEDDRINAEREEAEANAKSEAPKDEDAEDEDEDDTVLANEAQTDTSTERTADTPASSDKDVR